MTAVEFVGSREGRGRDSQWSEKDAAGRGRKRKNAVRGKRDAPTCDVVPFDVRLLRDDSRAERAAHLRVLLFVQVLAILPPLGLRLGELRRVDRVRLLGRVLRIYELLQLLGALEVLAELCLYRLVHHRVLLVLEVYREVVQRAHVQLEGLRVVRRLVLLHGILHQRNRLLPDSEATAQVPHVVCCPPPVPSPFAFLPRHAPRQPVVSRAAAAGEDTGGRADGQNASGGERRRGRRAARLSAPSEVLLPRPPSFGAPNKTPRG